MFAKVNIILNTTSESSMTLTLAVRSVLSQSVTVAVSVSMISAEGFHASCREVCSELFIAGFCEVPVSQFRSPFLHEFMYFRWISVDCHL